MPHDIIITLVAVGGGCLVVSLSNNSALWNGYIVTSNPNDEKVNTIQITNNAIYKLLYHVFSHHRNHAAHHLHRRPSKFAFSACPADLFSSSHAANTCMYHNCIRTILYHHTTHHVPHTPHTPPGGPDHPVQRESTNSRSYG
jgi:hypothetical protein